MRRYFKLLILILLCTSLAGCRLSRVPKEEDNNLFVIGFSQLFMCAEITTSGAFAGLGRTLPPSVVSIFFTFMRVPVILILQRVDYLSLRR